MDINEQQQINTFVKGMNTDTSDALLSNDQYRFAKNLRLTTNGDSNSGELHMIEGNIESGCINNIEGDYTIIAATSIRNYGIIITKKLYQEQGQEAKYKWSIYRFTEEPGSAEQLFGPCETEIWDGDDDKVSLLTRYESENNIKLYIADGIHEIMSINIAQVPEQSNIPNDIHALIGYTNVMLPPLQVEISQSSGQLSPARVQYAYRLYSKKGAATKLSALSRPLSLYKDLISGYASIEKTGRAVDITLPNTIYSAGSNTYLDYIQIFRITYVENGQLPTVTLIKDQKYENNQTVIDSGATDIQTIGVPEFLSYVKIGVIPKLIESKNDYLFAANVKYKQDDVDNKFKNIDVTTQTDENNNKIGSGEYFQWQIDYGDLYRINPRQQSESIEEQYTTYRPGETYRFGVILYDEEGNASSVKHIQDITIPNYDEFNYYIQPGGAFGNKSFISDISVYPIVIKFNLKESIAGCSAYEIVRCIRTLNDKRVITQGIVGRPLQLYKYDTSGQTPQDDPTDKICPSGFMTLDYYYVNNQFDNEKTTTCIPVSDVLQFASPEIVCQPDDMRDILNSNTSNLAIKFIADYTVPTKYKTYGIGNPTIRIVSDELTEMSLRFDLISSGVNNYCAAFFAFTAIENRDEDGDKLLKYQRGDKVGYISFNYIVPYGNSGRDDIPTTPFKIDDISYPDVPEYNSFSSNEQIRFQDDSIQIGSYQYTAWSAPNILDVQTGSSSDLYKSFKENGEMTRPDTRGAYYGLGTGGRCILLKLNQDLGTYYGDFIDPNQVVTDTYGTGLFNITVADIVKPTVPYGGVTEASLKNSVYYSFGDNFGNTPNIWHTLNSGDCYIKMFQYNALHNWFDTTFVYPTKMGTVYNVPIMSDIDMQGQYGYIFDSSNAKSYYIQDTPAAFDGYTQDKSSYLYNTAYNAYPNIIGYTAAVRDEKDSDTFDVRVHYSEQKTNGEDIDNWLHFKSDNFIDVDSRYGEITNLRLFKDRLVFWQNRATGMLAVNERAVLQDASAAQVVLGTGAVLERYDYFTTVYGMKPNQQADTQSSSALYWWDGYNKEILQYAGEYAATPLSTVKYIKNYLNNGTENDVPHLVYDNNYKEVVCNCVNNESVVYNEFVQQFISVYSFMPVHSVVLNANLYTSDMHAIYLQNRCSYDNAELFTTDITPYIKYIVNKNNIYNKTFDIQTFGGRFYGGSEQVECEEDTMSLSQNLTNKYHTTNEENKPLWYINATYKTPLKQEGRIQNGAGISNREYDYRLNVPRQGKEISLTNDETTWVTNEYGDRLRGKTMQCELWSTNNSIDFSLQYITTKYRMSWS